MDDGRPRPACCYHAAGGNASQVPGISKLLFGAGFAPAFDFTLFELRGDTKVRPDTRLGEREPEGERE